MVLYGRQRREGKVQAEISRLWPHSLNTHCPTGVCVPCVAFVLGCEVSQDSAVEENEVQLEIPWDATFTCVSGSIGFPWWLRGQSICLQCGRPRFDPWAGKIPWKRKWQPTPVFLPGKSHGWGSLVAYSPWGHKESDKTERFHFTQVP